MKFYNFPGSVSRKTNTSEGIIRTLCALVFQRDRLGRAWVGEGLMYSPVHIRGQGTGFLSGLVMRILSVGSECKIDGYRLRCTNWLWLLSQLKRRSKRKQKCILK